MCQSRVVTVRGGQEELVMDDVVIVRPQDGGLFLQDLYGKEKVLRARIKECQLMDHRIVIEEA